MKRLGFWALLAATLGLYLVIVLWSLPYIAAQADGLTAFDIRPGGYTHAEAQAFLSALTPEGRAHYEGPQRILDMAYPVLLVITLSWAVWRLSTDLPEWVAPILILFASIGASFDFLENMHVARMLAAGPDDVTPALVDAASTATVNKSLLTTLVLFSLLGLLIRAWRQRGR